MIGILGGMGTQAGLDFCNKLTMLNRDKVYQKYPVFILYNKSNIPGRPENLHKYNKVLKSLMTGCILLQKNKCKFIVIPCNTEHYWYDDLQKKIKITIISMKKENYIHTKNKNKKNSKKPKTYLNNLSFRVTHIFLVFKIWVFQTFSLKLLKTPQK